MSTFAESYIGQLRPIVGTREMLVPGARILIETVTGEILLELKRWDGSWQLPGGCAELAESIEEVARREVLEESGLTVSNLIPFGYASDPAHERGSFENGDRYHAHAMLFVTTQFSGDIRPQVGENVALEWFHPDRLPARLHSQVTRALDAYKRFLATGGDFQLC